MMWLLSNKWAIYAAAALGLLIAAWTALGVHDHAIRAAAESACEAKFAKASQLAAIAYEADKEAERVRQRKNDEKVANAIQAFNPVSAGLAGRLYYYQVRSCALPGTPAASSLPGQASGESGGAAEIERATQEVFDAATRDAIRLNGARDGWPGQG